MSLVEESLNKDAIETTKSYLQKTKKLRSLKIENYIRRVKTLNNYITLMKEGTVKLTERELIKQLFKKFQ